MSLLCLDKIDFKWVFGIVKDTEGNVSSTDHSTQMIVEMLKTLTETRKNKESEFINKNMVFRALTETQRVQMNMFIRHMKIPQGEILWGPTKSPTFCFFLYSGECVFTTPQKYKRREKAVIPGNLVGDFPCLLGVLNCLTEMRAQTELEILAVKKEDLLIFLGKNPGIALIFRDEYLIE